MSLSRWLSRPSSGLVVGVLLISAPATHAGLVIAPSGSQVQVPDEIEADAQNLLDQFGKFEVDELRSKEIVGTICATLDCGILQTEAVTSLLNLHFTSKSEQETQARLDREYQLKVLGLIVSVIAVLVSLMSFVKSSRAQKQSAKVSTELESVKLESAEAKSEAS